MSQGDGFTRLRFVLVWVVWFVKGLSFELDLVVGFFKRSRFLQGSLRAFEPLAVAS